MSEDRTDPADPVHHIEPCAEDNPPAHEPAPRRRHLHHDVRQLASLLKARQAAIRKSFRSIDHAVDECFKAASLTRRQEPEEPDEEDIIEEVIAEIEGRKPSKAETATADSVQALMVRRLIVIVRIWGFEPQTAHSSFCPISS